MSKSSAQFSQYPQHHPHDHGRAFQRRPAAAVVAAASLPAADDAYTIVHHGKQVRLGPVVFWIVVGTVVLLGLWSAATATYFAFRDDVLTRLIARQAEMQYAYEDRIAELRAKVDRTTSRQLLDQEQFDQKLDQIMKRQTALESRATALGAMPDVTGSIPRAAPQRGEANQTQGTPKPSPISDTVIFVAPPDREARLESRAPVVTAPPANQFAKNQGFDNVLVRLTTSLDQVERRQVAALSAVEDSIDSRIRRMRSVVSDLGLNLASLESAVPRAPMGGPFVPVKLAANAGPFEKQLYRINTTRAEMDRLNRTLAQVPYRKPVVGEVEFTSGFGVRSDPFLGRPAMHTGLDFRAATGDPARVTANGKVVAAGWSGGYGRMVEVDHGNGLSTRYGHLSEINVKVGETVKIGQVIGLVGSTGRSTGPHLHYETRIDGEAVDPQKFLRAGVKLSAG